ncbi:DUF4843 domain-containing protein [Sphingobacterium alkalisoli]|nr:DUF4843 domain-containing protein [Sphingobacterium alkalisoli]GGH27736.1 DUF4843 domain-containing protein [Sphingobacterium alkalisoli]
MKKIILHFVWLIPVLVLFSCEKELHKYEGKPTIYFNEAGRLPDYSSEVIKDSTLLSFSLVAVEDSIVNMVVKVIGEKSPEDRAYTLSVSPNSDAIEGVHYEVLDDEFVIRKNELTDTVNIKFFRTADMQEKTFLLGFDLLENENFAIAMFDKILNQNTGKLHSYVTYRWFLNDIIKKPGRWLDGYLGTFSRKKLFLMVDVLNVDPAYMDTSISIAEILAYGKYMQRYLNEQRAAGNTILEEDGTVMVMGASSQ